MRQRPQHLISRLARRVPVLFVEEPIAATADGETSLHIDGLTVLRPQRGRVSSALDEASVDAIHSWIAGRPALGWFYSPMMFEPARDLAFDSIVFDSMDDLAAFDFAPPQLREREAALVARADVVFAGGRSLYERLRPAGDKVVLHASGVDVAHFALASDPAAADPLVRALRGPVFGYFGVVDERLDLGLFAELAEAGGDVVVAGPVVKIDAGDLPGGARIHYTGLVPYARLPALLAGFDIALMPFAINASTRTLSPTKTPEYLAGRRPVISTPIADVARDYGDVVDIVPRDTFVRAAFERLHTPDPERLERGARAAERSGWDAIESAMWSAITPG